MYTVTSLDSNVTVARPIKGYAVIEVGRRFQKVSNIFGETSLNVLGERKDRKKKLKSFGGEKGFERSEKFKYNFVFNLGSLACQSGEDPCQPFQQQRPDWLVQPGGGGGADGADQ